MMTAGLPALSAHQTVGSVSGKANRKLPAEAGTKDELRFSSTKKPDKQATSALSVQSPEVRAYLKSFPEFGPPPFNADFHADRRARFIAQLPPDTTVIIPGAGLKPRNGDVSYPFRQESNFYYLTGFDEPYAVAILSNVPGQPPFTLVVPPRNPVRETWDGKRAGKETAIQKFRADAAYDTAELSQVLKLTAQYGKNVVLLPTVAYPEVDRTLRWELFKAQSPAGQVQMAAVELLKRLNQWFKLKLELPQPEAALDEALNRMRLIKTPYEIALLKRACDISSTGHRNAMRTMKLTDRTRAGGRNEGEIQAKVEYDFRRHGGVRLGYETIAGSGANTCVLHYNTNREFAKPGDLELVDAGAEYGYYTADITRTWPINGRFTPEQRTIYDLVLKAQQAGIAMAKPGVTLAEIHDACAGIITEGLVDLGILKGEPAALMREVKESQERREPAEVLRTKGYFKYFMHGTSHMLGMDVHDVPLKNAPGSIRNGSIRQKPLQPGMVFTVEPGIYIDPEVARENGVDPKWWGIGVRIEDDILITDTGHENLSGNLPVEADEIEALMNPGQAS